MPKRADAQDNFDRLLKHLKPGALSVQLVQAYRNPGPADRAQSIKAVLVARLEQVRKDLAKTKT